MTGIYMSILGWIVVPQIINEKTYIQPICHQWIEKNAIPRNWTISAVGYGGLQMEFSVQGNEYTIRIVDQGLGGSFWFGWQLPNDWVNQPLILQENGPSTHVSSWRNNLSTIVGSQSIRTGNRLTPIWWKNDGTNKWGRFHREIAPGGTPGTEYIWKIKIARCHLCDFDASGKVDSADLSILLGAWGNANSYSIYDLNRDGKVDSADMSILLGAWDQGFGLP